MSPDDNIMDNMLVVREIPSENGQHGIYCGQKLWFNIEHTLNRIVELESFGPAQTRSIANIQQTIAGLEERIAALEQRNREHDAYIECQNANGCSDCAECCEVDKYLEKEASPADEQPPAPNTISETSNGMSRLCSGKPHSTGGDGKAGDAPTISIAEAIEKQKKFIEQQEENDRFYYQKDGDASAASFCTENRNRIMITDTRTFTAQNLQDVEREMAKFIDTNTGLKGFRVVHAFTTYDEGWRSYCTLLITEWESEQP